MTSVLEAQNLRIDVDGMPDVDGLAFATAGERVLLLGGSPSLFHAAAGLLKPRHGHLLTSGMAPSAARDAGVMASAPVDSPLPPAWTTVEYVGWSSRLAGHDAASAAALAREALASMKLLGFEQAKLRNVPLPARRAIGVAAALATGATTLLLEDPTRGLPDDAARNLARVIARGTDGRRLVTFAARAALASPLAMDADEVVVMGAGGVLAQGAPAEVAALDRTYAVRVHGPGQVFADLAARRGARVSGQGASWIVELGATLRQSDLFDVAAAADVVVIDLRPVTGALS